MHKQKPLKEKTKKQSNRIPLVLTHNRTLPHVNRATTNNWNLLHINREFKDVFQEPPIVTFRRNRNIYGLLGWRNIVDGKLQRQSMRKEIRFSTKCFSKLGNLLKAMWHKKTYHMLHDLNCKSKLLIYILWNLGSAVSHTLENVKHNLILDWIIIVGTLIDKILHNQKLPNHNFNQHARFTFRLDHVNRDKKT